MLCRWWMGADATDCEKLESLFRDGILHRGVEVLECVIIFHLGLFDAGCVATGAHFAEFLKTARQLAIGSI